MKEVTGDILLTKSEALAHGIAVNDDFKQGLALSLRERWPGLYKDFRHFCKTTSPKEGDIWAWKGPGSPVIYCLFTQAAPKAEGQHPGKASLPNLNHSLKKLVNDVKEQKVKSLAITKVSTGVGGLDWKDVKPMLAEHFASLKIPVTVYATFKSGVAAE